MAETLRDIAEFVSGKFAPFLPDEAQVNPGVFGAEVAFWLARRLAEHGVVTSYPQNEDWGWYLDYRLPSGSVFAVHCSNTRDTADAWQFHLLRRGHKLFGRNLPPFREARALVDATSAHWRKSPRSRTSSGCIPSGTTIEERLRLDDASVQPAPMAVDSRRAPQSETPA